jgi:hypothetical protein
LVYRIPNLCNVPNLIRSQSSNLLLPLLEYLSNSHFAIGPLGQTLTDLMGRPLPLLLHPTIPSEYVFELTWSQMHDAVQFLMETFNCERQSEEAYTRHSLGKHGEFTGQCLARLERVDQCWEPQARLATRALQPTQPQPRGTLARPAIRLHNDRTGPIDGFSGSYIRRQLEGLT